MTLWIFYWNPFCIACFQNVSEGKYLLEAIKENPNVL